MSNLRAFPTEAKAEEVRQKLLARHKGYLIEFGDAGRRQERQGRCSNRWRLHRRPDERSHRPKRAERPVKTARSCLTGPNRRTLRSSDREKRPLYCIRRRPSCEWAPFSCGFAP
jgi:hypothetical protein